MKSVLQLGCRNRGRAQSLLTHQDQDGFLGQTNKDWRRLRCGVFPTGFCASKNFCPSYCSCNSIVSRPQIMSHVFLFCHMVPFVVTMETWLFGGVHVIVKKLLRTPPLSLYPSLNCADLWGRSCWPLLDVKDGPKTNYLCFRIHRS